VSEDELLIGISKINSNVYLGDVKDFASLIKSSSRLGTDASGKIAINDIVSLLGGQQ
jgi:hypothetical protein